MQNTQYVIVVMHGLGLWMLGLQVSGSAGPTVTNSKAASIQHVNQDA